MQTRPRKACPTTLWQDALHLWLKLLFMKRFTFLLLFMAFVTGTVRAKPRDEELKKKNLSDTILKGRTLTVPDPFDAQKALLALFPGIYYNLSSSDYNNELISWECKTCTPKACIDVNGMEDCVFPATGGVATRLMNVMDYSDAAGQQYKVISFNHSEYDADGITTGRFSGGILGLAKFMRTPEGWKLRIFQPVVRAYGAFSQCPTPKALLIGEDQYAFLIKHLNGGAGGPFGGATFLIAGADGSYLEVLAAYGTERTEGGEAGPNCNWKSEVSCPVSTKKYFRDIIITTKGRYYASDKEGMPEAVSRRLKGKKEGSFTIVRQYIYKGSGTGYVAQPENCTVN